MSSERVPEGQSDHQPDLRTIDVEAAAEIVAAAAARGDALDLIVPGVPGLEIRGIQPRRRATFGAPFLTVFQDGLVFVVEKLTHRELRVFAALVSVQPFGEAPIPLRPSDIAAALHLTPSAVSKAVARMRALGILQVGRTVEGDPVGLRISRRVLFRGNAFSFSGLRLEPALADLDEPPMVQRQRRINWLFAARGALATPRARPRAKTETSQVDGMPSTPERRADQPSRAPRRSRAAGRRARQGLNDRQSSS